MPRYGVKKLVSTPFNSIHYVSAFDGAYCAVFVHQKGGDPSFHLARRASMGKMSHTEVFHGHLVAVANGAPEIGGQQKPAKKGNRTLAFHVQLAVS